MHEAINRIMKGARQGFTDTQVEFGTLEVHSPVVFRLHEDPAPLKETDRDLVFFHREVFTVLDVGATYALARCSNGQYLVLGKVK